MERECVKQIESATDVQINPCRRQRNDKDVAVQIRTRSKAHTNSYNGVCLSNAFFLFNFGKKFQDRMIRHENLAKACVGSITHDPQTLDGEK